MCVYVYMYIYIYVHTYLAIHLSMYPSIDGSMYCFWCICIYIYTLTSACINTFFGGGASPVWKSLRVTAEEVRQRLRLRSGHPWQGGAVAVSARGGAHLLAPVSWVPQLPSCIPPQGLRLFRAN